MKHCIIFCAFLSCISRSDTTLLWRINVDPPAYLLGTVHLPYSYLWPSLSSTAKSAFENSTNFLPEFDVTNFFSFTRFRICITSHIPSPVGASATPGFIGSGGSQLPVMDIYLTLQARRMGKNVESLESVELYCEFTKFQADSLKEKFASNSSRPPFPTEKENEEVKHAYNCDLNNREELFTPSVMNTGDKALLEFKQRLETIVARRDAKSAEKIDGLLKNASPTNRYFFAVGYVHLMSPTGIITRLRRDYNYSITRLCTDPIDFRSNLACEGPSWCDPIAGL